MRVKLKSRSKVATLIVLGKSKRYLKFKNLPLWLSL